MTFQTVLSTDGNISFAAFIYDDPQAVVNIFNDREIGFNAGDSVRANVALKVGQSANLEAVNIFRIDGKK